MRQASIITLGCKVNAFDTALIWDGLEKKGYSVSDEMNKADVYVINTCTVTNNAGSQSRQTIRRVRRLNPDAKVIVTGCHAQVNPGEVAGIEGVDLVVGNVNKEGLLDFLDVPGKKEVDRVKVDHIATAEKLEYREIANYQRKSRAVLRVQDGCEAFCTYCIIPYARGKSRSLPMNDIKRQVIDLSKKGYREIVLTGIHLGAYGLDLPDRKDILSLLVMLESLDLDVRFRISSIEPNEISEEMMDFLVSSKKMCRHLHIPLQSGDERVLKKMGRNYTPSYFMEKVEDIVSRWDGVAVGVDVISGFPGEDEAAFLSSYRLLEKIPASYLHVFPFSKRDGTPAATMEGQVEISLIKERCAELRLLSESKRSAFWRGQVGKRLNVVGIERIVGALKTLSDNYIEIKVDTKENLLGSKFNVELLEYSEGGCRGALL